MGLTLVTAPATEPVTLTEAKAQCRVETSFTADDTYLTTLITVARQQAESFTRRAFITQTWDWTLDRFPYSDETPLEVPYPVLQSVTSITYTDTNGDSQTWGASNYTVDITEKPGRIRPAYLKSWPTARDHINAVTVRYVAGYGGASAVPVAIKQAMLLMIGDWYDNRSNADFPMPAASHALLWPYRVMQF